MLEEGSEWLWITISQRVLNAMAAESWALWPFPALWTRPWHVASSADLRALCSFLASVQHRKERAHVYEQLPSRASPPPWDLLALTGVVLVELLCTELTSLFPVHLEELPGMLKGRAAGWLQCAMTCLSAAVQLPGLACPAHIQVMLSSGTDLALFYNIMTVSTEHEATWLCLCLDRC